MATPEVFAHDPKLIWEWYAMRMQVCLDAKPNPGHEVVAKMESYFPEFLLVTQNVDNLHARSAIFRGAYSIEINPDSSTLSKDMDMHFTKPSGEILPQIWQEIIEN